jgi:uncharacterized protein (TIGR02147 family)
MAPAPLSLYQFDDYKAFLTQFVERSPGLGRGTYNRMAKFLGVNTTFVSQVIRGPKDFSVDQALLVSEFLGLGAEEEKYWLLLVQRDRCGHHKAKSFFTREISRMRAEARSLSSRVPKHHVVEAKDQAMFYSHYLYSAVRLLTGIKGYRSPSGIAERLGLTREKTGAILEFLVRVGLCRSVNGRYEIGPANTHVDKKSSWVGSHHTNWRLKAIENLPRLREDDLAFTAPLTVTPADAARIVDLLRETVERASKVVEGSEPEDLYCLNLDFFRV